MQDLYSQKYIQSRFLYKRRTSLPVHVGAVQVGGDSGIVIQSMTTTPTADVSATLKQCISLADKGCQMIRITAPSLKEARALEEIRNKFSLAGYRDIPLIADIHFLPKAAMEAIEHVEKVRVNPGNYADNKRFVVKEYSDSEYMEELERVYERFSPLVKRAKVLGKALRIGVNHGSLSDRIMNRFGDSPRGMVESAMEFIRIAESNDFNQLIVSMKSSNPKVMVQAYRLLVAALDKHGVAYPLHLGVTEAGDGEDGRVKGAAGIGTLLEDGIGDTIRVSLTEEPEEEIPVCKDLIQQTVPAITSKLSLNEAPCDLTNPYEFVTRKSELVRIKGVERDLVCGGGQVPKVFVDIEDGNEPKADAVIELGCDSNALIMTNGTTASDEKRMVFLKLDSNEPYQRLQKDLGAIPGSKIVSLSSFGSLEPIHAYRLLAAVDEHLFNIAEKEKKGSGVRHAICLSMLEEKRLLKLASVTGSLLMDGIGDILYLPAIERSKEIAFTILQAVKARVTRTDYVACPSCGRTLFDLMEVTEHIKEVTQHLDGVTIAIMGCIVNGPGEMADADFGYVGAGPGKITLYKGKTPVKRNVPSTKARDELVSLIKEAGMWKDAPKTQVNLRN